MVRPVEGRLLIIDDLHKRLTRLEEHAAAMLEWKESIEESTAVNRKMIEVGEAMIEVFGWLGKFSKWSLSIAGMFMLVRQAFRTFIH